MRSSVGGSHSDPSDILIIVLGLRDGLGDCFGKDEGVVRTDDISGDETGEHVVPVIELDASSVDPILEGTPRSERSVNVEIDEDIGEPQSRHRLETVDA